MLIITPYKRLIVANRSLIGFGFMMALYSSVGQTFLVGVFGPQIQSEFRLTHTAWSTIYMIGTLASAAVMPWSGNLIDRYRLPGYALAVCGLMVCACGFFPFVTGPITLVLGIFLLRHSGQGLAHHTANTSMGRYFERDRGRAIAIASLGLTVGEAALPYLAVVAISAVGWRWTYGGIAAAVAITSFPAILWLLRGYDSFHQDHLKRLDLGKKEKENVRSWKRQQVLRDPRFYLLLPGVMAPSMIATAFFFHHLNLAKAKGWDAMWVTGNYVIYAVACVLAILAAGLIVDRFRANRVVQFMLIPLVMAAVTIGIADHYLWVLPYMLLLGLHTGFAHTSINAIWAELYGVAHLGSIRSMHAALSVLFSAFGPVIIGILVDLGVPIEDTWLLLAAYALLGNILIILALRLKPIGNVRAE
jgi:MFS family permease